MDADIARLSAAGRWTGGSKPLITRKDIAERLGVSVSVVSRALNNSGYVHPEKRRQILEMARELDYGREPAALRSLERKTRCILFSCANMRNPFNVEVYNGIIEAAQERDYRVLLTPLVNRDIDFTMADGVIFANENTARVSMNACNNWLPVPAVAASYGEHLLLPQPIPIIDCDLWKGTEALVDYLRRRGHSRIAMVSPYPIDTNNTRGIAWRACMEPVLEERLTDYYFEAMMHSPVPMDSGDPAAFDGFFENGAYAAELFAKSGCDATAVICFNEEMGLGFCREMQHRGVRIPEDVSVASYDGTFMRFHHELPLTVLDLRPAQLGRECFKALMKTISGQRVRRVTLQPTDILEGATVRALN